VQESGAAKITAYRIVKQQRGAGETSKPLTWCVAGRSGVVCTSEYWLLLAVYERRVSLWPLVLRGHVCQRRSLITTAHTYLHRPYHIRFDGAVALDSDNGGVERDRRRCEGWKLGRNGGMA
jgi:hypothetical protein